MKYKLLAFDIDGTLTNSEKIITDATKEAIFKAMYAGATVAIATGRPVCGAVRYAGELRLKENNGYIMSLNGGIIVRCSDDKVISRSLIPHEYYEEIYRLAAENDVNIMTYDGDTVVSEVIDDPYLSEEARLNGLDKKQVDNLLDYLDYDVPKFLMLGDGDRLAQVEKNVYAKLHDRLDVYRSEPYFLEILPKNVNKASGLEKLALETGAERNEIMAFGDGFNDISMIEYAGTGVAMGNANEKARKKADIVAPTNDEDGIAWVINKFVLD